MEVPIEALADNNVVKKMNLEDFAGLGETPA
jgi:hypothetical protein